MRIEITAAFRENRMAIIKWALYLLMCGYFMVSCSHPAEPAVQRVFFLVEAFGAIAVVIVPAVLAVIATINATFSVAEIASRFMRGVTVSALALWLIGHTGDSAFRWISANSKEAAIGAVSFAIVLTIIRWSGGFWRNRQRIVVRSLEVAPVAVAAPKPTGRDNQYTAAHEAGHALVYAELGCLPPDIEASMNDRPDNNGVLGFVTGPNHQHQLDERTFAEWYMLFLLAGQKAELTIMAETTLGSTNDHDLWMRVARRYLANHFRGMFYAGPENEFEQRKNEDQLDALQARQSDMLISFFNLNADVLKELAESLQEKRTITRDNLIPFLDRVQLPEGFPCPSGRI